MCQVTSVTSNSLQLDCSLPGASVHGTLQRNLPNPETEPVSPAAPMVQEDSLPLSHGQSQWKNRRRET